MDNVVNPPPWPPPLVNLPREAAWERVAFSGRRPDYRRLVTRGAFLELITVGFYRFWLATDMRRHLWSHTSVGSDALEYVGTAKELFLGFLFAMAVLVPIYVLNFLIGIEAERMKAFASVPLGLFFYLFFQFAVYRARRYRLTRTIWRGVRFGMVGSGWNYAWRAGLWSFFATLTLGLALPWRQAALERFKMRHTAYGDLEGRFEGTGWDFFKRGWWLWLLSALAMIVPLIVLTLFYSKNYPSPVFWGFYPFLIVLLLPFVIALYRAIEWRWWVSGIRFGDVYFDSDLKARALLGLYWKVIGWGFLLLVLLFAWGGLVFVALMYLGGLFDGSLSTNAAKLQIQRIGLQPTFLIAVGFGYIVVALMYVAVIRIYLIRDIWQRVAGTAHVYNLASAENVLVRGEVAGAIGEGFADSLDIAGF